MQIRDWIWNSRLASERGDRARIRDSLTFIYRRSLSFDCLDVFDVASICIHLQLAVEIRLYVIFEFLNLLCDLLSRLVSYRSLRLAFSVRLLADVIA